MKSKASLVHGNVLKGRRLEFATRYTGDSAETARLMGAKDPKNYGYRMLKDPLVAAAIEKRNAIAIATAGRALGGEIVATVESVKKEIARLGFSDIRRMFNPDDSAKKITELDDDTAAAVSSVEFVDYFEGSGEDRRQVGYIKKFKLADKGQNLERLAKILGMFIERHIDLPADWDNHTLEEQEYFAKHRYWPEPHEV
jgi:hypothetical protein